MASAQAVLSGLATQVTSEEARGERVSGADEFDDLDGERGHDRAGVRSESVV